MQPYNYNFYYNLCKNDIWSHYYQWSSFRPQWDILDYLDWKPFSEFVKVIISNLDFNISKATAIISNIDFNTPKAIVPEIDDWDPVDGDGQWWALSNNILYSKQKVGDYYDYYYYGKINFKDIIALDREIQFSDIQNLILTPEDKRQIIEIDYSELSNNEPLRKYYLYNLPFHTGVIINKQGNIKIYCKEDEEFTNINIKNQDIVYSIDQNLNNENKDISNYIFTSLPSTDGYYLTLNYDSQGHPYYRMEYTTDIFLQKNQIYTTNFNFYFEKYFVYQRFLTSGWNIINTSDIYCLDQNRNKITNSYLTDPAENYMLEFYQKNNNNTYENLLIDYTEKFEELNENNIQIQQLNIQTQPNVSSENYIVRIY